MNLIKRMIRNLPWVGRKLVKVEPRCMIEGYLSARFRKCIEVRARNPYDRSTKEHVWWNAGWDKYIRGE